MKYRKVNLAQFVVKYGHTLGLDHPRLVSLSLGVCLLFYIGIDWYVCFFRRLVRNAKKRVGGELWAAMRGFIAGPSSIRHVRFALNPC
jgi:hypothetical protein